jgi:hypothetical protein
MLMLVTTTVESVRLKVVERLGALDPKECGLR